MRYENESGEPLEESQIDLNLGHVCEERRLVAHHEATPEVTEQGHWQDVYKDGQVIGQTWIVDVPYQPARDAWDEYETVGVYIPYTDEELVERAAEQAEFNRTAAVAEQSRIAVMAMMAVNAVSLSDEQVAETPALFPEWTVGGEYKTGGVARYKSGLWRALQDSTGEAQYPPDAYVAGWKRIGEPDESGVYPWSQPYGATDAYAKGAKVTYGGRTWVSNLDNNVWTPGEYGWTVDGGQSADEWPEFVQPTGSHDAYKKGDRVTFDGKRYESLIDGNVWSPADNPSGWREVADAGEGGE